MSELPYVIRPVADEDRGYVLVSMRDGIKQNPSYDRVPWSYLKGTIGVQLSKIVNDETTKLLGAYAEDGTMLGWICVSPGKRVDVVHWIYTRFEHAGKEMRRRGIMLALLEEGVRGERFVYTIRGRRTNDLLANGEKARSLDNVLAEALLSRGISATYVPLKEWLS